MKMAATAERALSQEPHLFHGTVRRKHPYGIRDASEEQ